MVDVTKIKWVIFRTCIEKKVKGNMYIHEIFLRFHLGPHNRLEHVVDGL